MDIGKDTDFSHFAPRSGCRRHGHNGQRMFIRSFEKSFIIEIIRAEQGNGLSGIHRRTAADTDDEVNAILLGKGCGSADRIDRGIVFNIVKEIPGNAQFIEFFVTASCEPLILAE